MFAIDSRTESYLKTMGVQHCYCEGLPFADLHETWKQNNLGRPEDTNQDAIVEYADRMEHGSSAPAVIVIKRNGHRYTILDGVQRLAAAELLDATAFNAYVIDGRTSLKTQHAIRQCSNGMINGQHTPDRGFLLRRAVEVLYFEDNCSVKDLCRYTQRKEADIRSEIRVQKTRRNLEGIGYVGKLLSKKWFLDQLGQSLQDSDFEQAPKPIKQMVAIAEKCKFPNGTLTKPIADFGKVNRKSSKDREKQFEGKLQEFKAVPEVRQKLGATDLKQTHIHKVLPLLRGALTVMSKASEADEYVHDQAFANDLAEVLRLMFNEARHLIPRDMQYPNGKTSSILDKG